MPTEPFTAGAHYATRAAFRHHERSCARAAANWAVALEYVSQHPGITIHELAQLLTDDQRITWSREYRSLAAKLSFGRNVDGAMGRAGIKSRKHGRKILLYTEAQLKTLEEHAA